MSPRNRFVTIGLIAALGSEPAVAGGRKRASVSCPMVIELTSTTMDDAWSVRPQFKSTDPGVEAFFVATPVEAGMRIERVAGEALAPVRLSPAIRGRRLRFHRLSTGMLQDAWSGVWVDVEPHVVRIPSGTYRLVLEYALRPRLGRRGQTCLAVSPPFTLLKDTTMRSEE